LLPGEGSVVAATIHQPLTDGLLVLNFLPHRGKTIEEQLAEIGQGDGVAAGDAFASELLDEIAEEKVHIVGGGEVLDETESAGCRQRGRNA
jgi:hypothetical protein